jgi:hypothetical protein
MSLRTIGVRGNGQQSEVSDLSNASGGSRPQVNHPGDPPADGVASAGIKSVCPVIILPKIMKMRISSLALAASW